MVNTRAAVSGLAFSNKLGHASLGFELEFSPTIGIAAGRIDKLGLDIRSFNEPLNRAIRQVMIPSIGANFADGGRPDRWVPLSAGTLEVRRRFGNPHDHPLLWTQTLYKAAMQVNIWKVTRSLAVVDHLPSRAWYGKIHQVGMRAREGSGGMTSDNPQPRDNGKREVRAIPARPFLVIQPEDRDAIRDIFVGWLDERVAKASWGKATGALG